MIATLCVDEASGINGQFFLVKKNEVGLFQPLTITQQVDNESDWRPDDLVLALGKLDLHPLDGPY